MTTKTDAKLAPGPYLVEALVPGFKLSSQRVTLGDKQAIELRLSALPKTNASAVGVNMDAEVGRGAGNATPVGQGLAQLVCRTARIEPYAAAGGKQDADESGARINTVTVA